MDLAEETARKQLRDREQAENDRALTEARVLRRNVTFIAHDGCEVTVTPDGHVFYNAADWW